MRYETVIFDVDGTIMDTDFMLVSNFFHMFQKYRPDYIPSLRELVSFSGPPLAETFPKYFKENVNYLISDFKEYSEEHYQYIKLYEHEIPVLQKMKAAGIKMGICSSKRRTSVAATLNYMKLTPYFDYIVPLEDCPTPKPSGSGIIKAMELAGGKKETTLYLGDTNVDLLAGIDAGVDVGIMAFSLHPLEAGLKPTYLIESFEELWEVINGN